MVLTDDSVLISLWLHRSDTEQPWPCFNIKMASYQYTGKTLYRKFHCGDNMVVRSSYLHNGNSYTGKMSFLYWDTPLEASFQTLTLTFWGRDKWLTFCRTQFQRHFIDENVAISIKISLKFVPNGPNGNKPPLVQMMACRLFGTKPLSETMMA